MKQSTARLAFAVGAIVAQAVLMFTIYFCKSGFDKEEHDTLWAIVIPPTAVYVGFSIRYLVATFKTPKPSMDPILGVVHIVVMFVLALCLIVWQIWLIYTHAVSSLLTTSSFAGLRSWIMVAQSIMGVTITAWMAKLYEN